MFLGSFIILKEKDVGRKNFHSFQIIPKKNLISSNLQVYFKDKSKFCHLQKKNNQMTFFCIFEIILLRDYFF